MLYIASVIDKRTKRTGTIKSEYCSRQEFADDLRRNGYEVRFIATKKSYAEVQERYNRSIKE